MKVPKMDGPEHFNHSTPGPGWLSVSQENGPHKPLIKCKCGKIMGIKLHSVSADGEVRASFHHSQAEGGCGFHEFIELEDYHGPARAGGED